ncbi:MAG: type II toxin-antitoxin system Phd/YefM family antitoxin [Phycisphaerales bacterium]|jgi:PHD/YefM family antitoxin component YafN of YafNO toxin-antitoxin module|nr:type II toxin-antitoxin system Phd/YefM family antitoxin [Phycisphaerales bacterium]
MIRPEDISPLTDFKRNTAAYIKQLKKSKRPAVLTVNGKAALIVADAGAYQAMLDELERAASAAELAEALAEDSAGRSVPLADAASLLRRQTRRKRAS